MGRKKDPNRRANAVAYQRPWCYYCDREFDADGILLQHQKAPLSEHRRRERSRKRPERTESELSLNMYRDNSVWALLPAGPLPGPGPSEPYVLAVNRGRFGF